MQKKWIAILIYIFIYVFSYGYLAVYHQTINLFPVIIHESGELNFLETLFYSSHFLAHIPVHIVVAFVFAGSIRFFGTNGELKNHSLPWLIILLEIFLILNVFHAFHVHGQTDTLEYILQKKQGHDIYGEGGSWKLHLVSTVTLVFFIPGYVFVMLRLLQTRMAVNLQGLWYVLAGIAMIPVFSLLCDGEFFAGIMYSFTNNRYLAHSVREMITFPVTYFPLFFLVFYDFRNFRINLPLKGLPGSEKIIIFGSLVFVFLMIYQVILPLTEGIDSLSQKPEFMKGEQLPLLYLITSHYFEHFLDTVFFVLLAGVLTGSYNNFRKSVA